MVLKYQMGETILEMMTNENDLGVFIDEELKFHQHIPRARQQGISYAWTDEGSFGNPGWGDSPRTIPSDGQSVSGIWQFHLAP